MFYLEVSVAGARHRFLLEKQQVAVLAERSLELINSVNPDLPAANGEGEELGAEIEPRFRVGEIALSYLPEAGTIRLMLAPTDDDDEAVEFEASLSQVQAMAVGAAAAVASGRPPCPRCSLPLDPDGHVCPGLNGDLRTARR